MQIAVGVLTVNRVVSNYLVDTLRSLRETSPGASVLVCVGSEDTSHVPTDVDVSVIPRQFLDKMPGRGPLYAITANMAHAYSGLLQRHPDADVFLVIEDDVAFAARWRDHIDWLIHAASKRSTMWVMSLCSSHDNSAFVPLVPTGSDISLWRHKQCLDFWGQQALAYTIHTFQWMQQHVVMCESTWQPSSPETRAVRNPNEQIQGDQAIKWFCHHNNVPLYVTNPSLVKHIGQKCSWGNGADSHAWTLPTKRFVP
jgi:hypothetical protein